MSEIFAVQLTAVATAILAGFAFITAIFALLAWRKQSQEVHAIEQQVKDAEEVSRQQAELLEVQSGQLEIQRLQYAQEQVDRRRAQASRIFIWTETGPDPRATYDQATGQRPQYGLIARVRNTSEQPIYHLNVDWGPEKPIWMEGDHFPVLMPGGQEDCFRSWDGEIDITKGLGILNLEPTASFRDATGLHWLLTPDGGLTESSTSGADASPDPDHRTVEQP